MSDEISIEQKELIAVWQLTRGEQKKRDDALAAYFWTVRSNIVNSRLRLLRRFRENERQHRRSNLIQVALPLKRKSIDETPVDASNKFEVGAVWRLANGRFFVHWFGYDNICDTTVEPESDVLVRILNGQSEDFLSTYPWSTGEEAIALKQKYPKATIGQIADALNRPCKQRNTAK